jgi:hypothetical protein
MVRLPGTWQSFDHLEESLTLDELILLTETANDFIDESRRFSASLQGVDLSGAAAESAEDRFNRIKEEAEAEARGMSTDALAFSDVGVGFVEEAVA